jgi:predicted transcriptional regulator
MATTIQVGEELLFKLKERKMYDKESYEEVIYDLLEDSMELSEETLKHIKQSEKEIKEGKTVSLEQIKKRLRL